MGTLLIKVDNKFWLTIFLVLLSIVVFFGYRDGIGVVFAYTGIVIKNDGLKIAVSFLMLLVIIWLSVYKIQLDYLGIVNILFLILSYIPTMVLWGINETATWGSICATFFSIICMMGACSLIQRVFPVKISGRTKTELNKKHFQMVVLLSVAALVFALAFRRLYGPNRWFLSFANSLDARLEFRELNINIILKYVYYILGGCVLPVLFIYSVNYRKYLIAIINVVSSFFLYTVNGMKSWIAIYFVIVLIRLLAKRDAVKIMQIFTLFLALLWFVGTLIFVCGGTHVVLAYLHRIQTLPAELHYHYYDFFNNNPLLYLRDSVGRFFAESPYSISASRTIGSIYYHSSNMNCTNGFFSDFYANFGFAGLLLYPFLVFSCLGYLGKLLSKYSVFVALGITTVLVFVLYDNPFFTWLLTGGYIFAVIIIKVIEGTHRKQTIVSNNNSKEG